MSCDEWTINQLNLGKVEIPSSALIVVCPAHAQLVDVGLLFCLISMDR